MRITVTQLADMWRAAADSLDSSPTASATNKAAAEQTRKLAKDLETTKFQHELIKDNPLSSKSAWLKRLK